MTGEDDIARSDSRRYSMYNEKLLMSVSDPCLREKVGRYDTGIEGSGTDPDQAVAAVPVTRGAVYSEPW